MDISKSIQKANQGGQWCHEFSAGAMVHSAWHGLAQLFSQSDMDTIDKLWHVATVLMGCLPVSIQNTLLGGIVETRDPRDGSVTTSIAPAHDTLRAIVCHYADDEHGNKRPPRTVGAVGSTYKHLSCANFKQLCEAAIDAGCRPEGIFALRNFSRIIATFELPTVVGGGRFKQYLTIIDSLDGSSKVQLIISTVRVVCANTVRSAQATCEEGQLLQVRHSGDMDQKTELMAEAITAATKQGGSLVDEYDAAASHELSDEQWEALLSDYAPLFETVTEEIDGDKVTVPKRDKEGQIVWLAGCPELATDKAKGKYAKALDRRNQINEAAKLEVNIDGGQTQATLYNAVTWCVDRKFVKNNQSGSLLVPATKTVAVGRKVVCPKTGEKIDPRSDSDKAAELLHSMVDPLGNGSKDLKAVNTIFTKQVEQFQVLINMADGTVEAMNVDEAMATGQVPESQVGKALLGAMLEG